MSRSETRKRHFRPTGTPIADGREFRHAQLRVSPGALENVRARARELGRPYAQVLGELVELAVERDITSEISDIPRGSETRAERHSDTAT